MLEGTCTLHAASPPVSSYVLIHHSDVSQFFPSGLSEEDILWDCNGSSGSFARQVSPVFWQRPRSVVYSGILHSSCENQTLGVLPLLLLRPARSTCSTPAQGLFLPLSFIQARLGPRLCSVVVQGPRASHMLGEHPTSSFPSSSNTCFGAETRQGGADTKGIGGKDLWASTEEKISAAVGFKGLSGPHVLAPQRWAVLKNVLACDRTATHFNTWV